MKVETLNYEGLAEQWKIDLLVSRAMRMGFREQDLEDVQQGIIHHIVQFRYDPMKSNGASERTALTAMIDNKLKMLKRNNSRYGKYVDRFQKIAEQTYEPSELRTNDIDVRLVVEKFTPEEQAVCRALGMGYTKNEIHELLGMGRAKLNRIVRQIHDQFAELGFNEDRR